MWEEKLIGTIKEVSQSAVVVLLSRAITSLTKKIGEKTYYIGQIGSYVLVPVGNAYTFGIVANFKKDEIAFQGSSEYRYLLTVTLIGTFRKGKFETGVAVLPTVDMPVFLLEDKDIRGAFAAYMNYNFSLGQLSLFETERAYLDPNKFFGKHIAVIGSSGSGKSYTVASILQKVAKLPDAHIVILDLHNEYRRAFPTTCQYCDISSLELPYWLLNAEEMSELFIEETDENASMQGSILQDFVYNAKKEKNPRLSDAITIDSPVYYDLREIISKFHFLDTEKISSTAGSKEGPYYGKFTRMLVRLESKLHDPRYAFMFQPSVYNSTENVVPLMQTIFGLGTNIHITVMDLSGVPFDIVKTIAALIARITFDFNFWNARHTELPILLVFEEAHNYLSTSADGSKAARRTVERIAKEGRKYGVTCMIVSQRPSEISETILSQCNSFVIMRLINPTDVEYISRLVPDSFTGLEAVIPLLRQGEALIVGDAIPIPQRVQIDFPNPTPQSTDVRFFDKWQQPGEKVDAEEVMESWWFQKRM
jgi:DNA helicase HerA-like ATPase